MKQTIKRRVFRLAGTALTLALGLALGGCGVFCGGTGTNGWVGGGCGTTVHF